MIRPRLLVLSLLLALGACDPPGGGTGSADLRMVFTADEGLGDRSLSGRAAYARGAAHIGLTGRTPDGRVVPALAASWRVLEEGRTYVFKLRPAEWPDGRRIDADDVVAVLRRQLAPGSDATLAPYMRAIENAAAVAANRKPARMLGVDDPRADTVVIRLERPSPNLLALLAEPQFAIVRAGDDPPPSGAFAHVEDGLAHRLIPNPAFYGAAARAPPTIALEETEIEDAVRDFEAGAADIVTGGTVAGLRRVRTSDLAPALRLEASWGLYGYAARTGAGPLSDVRVRRALAMTVPRETLGTELFLIDGMQPAFGPLPPTMPEAYAGVAPDWAVWTGEARLTEARRLLGEAGYGEGRPLTLDVAIPRADAHERILAAVAGSWATLGVRVRAMKRTAAAHREVLASGDFDLALTERIAPAPLPLFFLRPFTCETRMMGGYCSPDVDRLLAAADEAADPGVRIGNIRRAARLIAEDAPIIPLFAPIRWSLVRPGIGGWEENMAGAHPPHYLDPEGATP